MFTSLKIQTISCQAMQKFKNWIHRCEKLSESICIFLTKSISGEFLKKYDY